MTTIDDKIKSLEQQLAIPVDEYDMFKTFNREAIKANTLFNECVVQIHKHRDSLAVELLKLKEEKARELE